MVGRMERKKDGVLSVKRAQPMRRTSMRKQPPERVRTVHTPGTGRGVMQRVGDEVRGVPKEAPVRSEAYLRLVASLPCHRCNIEGHTQACHGDEGKGLGIKSSDLTAWPGCGPRPGVHGCHWLVGTSGYMSRDQRRLFEDIAAAHTRRTLRAMALEDEHVRKVLRDVGLLP